MFVDRDLFRLVKAVLRFPLCTLRVVAVLTVITIMLCAHHQFMLLPCTIHLHNG